MDEQPKNQGKLPFIKRLAVSLALGGILAVSAFKWMASDDAYGWLAVGICPAIGLMAFLYRFEPGPDIFDD